MTDAAVSETGRDAAALFEFLARLVQLRSRPVRDVDEYRERLWLASLPIEPEVRTALDQDEPDEWFAVRRPRITPAPDLPPELAGWVDPAAVRDPAVPPVVRDPAPFPVSRREPDGRLVTSTEDRRLADYPGVAAAWSRYRVTWDRWAPEARRAGSVYEVYSSLFAMNQLATQLGEQYETVVGVGLLLARTETGDVRRHLLTRRARVTFEEQSGRIAVIPDEDNPDVVVETDMLGGSLAVPGNTLEAVRRQLAEAGSGILSRARILPILTSWVNAASPNGLVLDGLVPPQGASDQPRIEFAPALILRPRSQRSLVSLYEAFIRQLNAGEDPPALVRGLVEIVEPTTAGTGQGADVDPEVYFPLAANQEQLRVVDQLRSHRGVVVVGPPGTGKSHTIANLVSDALARGKRVVVTSHTGRALEVLVDKLPDDIRDLCVIMAGEGRGLSLELRRSIDAILGRSSDPDWTPETTAENADRLRTQIERAEAERAEALARRRELREREVVSRALGFGGYQGTLAKISERLANERADRGWIPDEVDCDAPLDGEQASEWLALERSVRGDAERRAQGAIPTPGGTSVPAEFKTLLEEWHEAADDVKHAADLETDPAWHGFTRAGPTLRETARRALRELRRAAEAAPDGTDDWLEEAVRDVLDGLEQPWRARSAVLDDVLARLNGTAAVADAVRIDGLTGRDPWAMQRQASALRAYLATGRGMGFGPFKPTPVRAAAGWLHAVTVNGAVPISVDSLDGLLAHLTALIALDDLRQAWGERVSVPPGSLVVARAVLLEVKERLDPILGLENWRIAARAAVADVDEVPAPRWSDVAQVRRLEQVAGAVDAVLRCHDADAGIAALAADLESQAGVPKAAPEVALLADAARSRDVAAYTDAYSALEEVRTLGAQLARRDRLFDRVAAAAPQLAGAVRADPDADDWQAWLAGFQAAWDHARATACVRRELDGGDAAALDTQLGRLDVRLRQYRGQLGATLAWRATLSRLTQHNKTHLTAYRLWMKRYGKGTGKHAPYYLAQARLSMNECIDAVPAWIMPTYRLAETITAKFEPFDLAIVDEASQSGVESLFVWALARQVVIVGDDQQISPEAVGIDLGVVRTLQEQLIPDIPQKGLFTPTASIFDQAQLRYPGKLQLREHFRCMPEIIAFSNALCYASSPLEPVRQFGTDRLEPLRAVHVRGGEDVNGVNKQEAFALVEQVAACCEDPLYRDASMGVISTTGDRQARYIQRLLIERLGPQVMIEHRMKCGDAYAFQGDQRRVMFLSMVVSPTQDGHRLPAQTGENIRQRFNVAASRAEDQAWLFHSVTLADLNTETCLRARLLAHFLDPAKDATEIDLGVIDDHDRRDPFESLFEQRVYRRIVARGYRVVPQYRVLGYRIDLVIVGGLRKLAVECDGEVWHGPEVYDRDTARQRDLERCGWHFVRISEAEFYLDADEALAAVWEALDRLGIRPVEIEPATTSPAPHAVVSTPQEPPAEPEVPAPAADAGAGPTLIDGPPPARALELAQPIQLPPAVPAAPPARSAPTLRAEPDFGPLRGFPARPSGAGGPPPQPFPVQPPESVQVPAAAAAALDAPHLGGTLGLDTGHAVAGAPGAELLTPFVPWPVRSLPRLLVPSTEIRDAVRGIVEHEGPVVVRRVATLYAMGVGRAALAREQRHVLNTVIYDMVRKRILEADRVARDADMGSWNVRLYSLPVTRIRERGARALLDIPISEIAALAQAMREGAPATDDVIADRILAIYGAAHASQAERSVVRKAVTIEAPADQAAMFAPTLLSVRAPEERPSSTASRGDNERVARLLDNAIEEVVNEALELGMNGLHRLGLSWEDGDAVAAIRTVVIERIATIGLTLSERELAVRVRDKMPNASGSARGAVVDAVLARVGMQLMDEEGLAVLMAPWERARRPAPTDDDTPRQQCVHGNTLGSCTQVTCPGHYLGGKSSDTDWRTDW